MTTPSVLSPTNVPASTPLVIGWLDGQPSASSLTGAELAEIRSAVEAIGAPTTPGATTVIPFPNAGERRIVAVSLPAEASAAELRRIAGSGVQAAGELGSLAVDIPHEGLDQWAAIAEGAALGAYRFTDYKSGDHTPCELAVVTKEDPTDAETEALDAMLEAQLAVRKLVNTPASDLLPQDLEAAARELVDGLNVEVTTWMGKDLETLGCGGIIGVGKGSVNEPRLVRLEWNPDAARHLALVGKGITFDSGGMSLKSHEGLIDMKTDMTGAATVAAAVYAAARLQLPVRVTAWMCIAENMLSGSAMRVGDVLRHVNGTTVEVNNTDAEGRLVLADGLSLAVKEEPDEVIDIATLTGAQIRALGLRYAGVMGTDDAVAAVEAAAERAGEYIWSMPLPNYLVDALDSQIADMKNTGGAEGGMLVAGLFLQKFVGDTPWAHIDIAGPSFNSGKPWGYNPVGATGYGVRTLVERARALALD